MPSNPFKVAERIYRWWASSARRGDAPVLVDARDVDPAPDGFLEKEPMRVEASMNRIYSSLLWVRVR